MSNIPGEFKQSKKLDRSASARRVKAIIDSDSDAPVEESDGDVESADEEEKEVAEEKPAQTNAATRAPNKAAGNKVGSRFWFSHSRPPVCLSLSLLRSPVYLNVY